MEAELVMCFNKLFKILNVKYCDFNTKILVKTPDQRDALLALEKEYPKLGVWGFNNNDGREIGISVISLLATITDFLCGKRLAVVVDEVEPYDSVIEGVRLLEYNLK